MAWNSYSDARKMWLLEIGRRLQGEYDAALAAPLPERVAALLKQLETSANTSPVDVFHTRGPQRGPQP